MLEFDFIHRVALETHSFFLSFAFVVLLNVRTSKVLEIENPLPVSFHFDITLLQSHEAIVVEPMSGTAFSYAVENFVTR